MNYIIYDLEATCWEGSRWEEMEIIEIGAVMLAGEHFQPMSDFEQLRRQILMPSWHDDASLRTEGPFAYRDLDECLALIEGYVAEEKRFAVMGYMGHL